MKKKVFIVDNEEGIIDALECVLNLDGIEVYRASNGEEALDTINDVLPDLVVIDVIMPGINGFEVCRRIRRNPEFRALPILMLTVKNNEADRKKGLSSGATEYMTKPFDIWEFSTRAKNLLECS